MSIQDDETLQMYVEESLEHLADIENDFLAIEEAGANIDEDLVNKVYRAAHSIKGGAGFMGLTKIKDLTHEMENILGKIRSKEMIPNPEIINILLGASDLLQRLINDVDSSNDMDISQQLDALKTISEAPDQEPPSIETLQKTPEIKDDKDMGSGESDLLSPGIKSLAFPDGKFAINVSEDLISEASGDGKSIYIVEIDLIHELQAKEKNLFAFIDDLNNTGSILEARIKEDAPGNLLEDGIPEHLAFLILFASILKPNDINMLFEIDPENIYFLMEDLTLSNLDEAMIEKQQEPDEEIIETQIQTEAIIDQPEVIAPQMVSVEKDTGPTKETSPAAAATVESSLRVHVRLLDSLMNLAGELVLSRNQLLQAISSDDQRVFEVASQRIDMITSELQEAIMLTRMQPIGNVFNKFPRVVRDLARNLGKEIELILEGKEVELDKTIIEAISDPLTHLVRNSVDHGIEEPRIRQKNGKLTTGTVLLKAYHEAGQVIIEISDDGNGIDGRKLADSAIDKGLITKEQATNMTENEKIQLIFMPGFSTAEKLTDVSGRGVGMDVVKTNLDKLGGVVDIKSQVGEGSRFRIKLPLTLAIIPSQIIAVGKERYAIPQVNMEELLRIPADKIKERIEKVGDADVVRLRGNLLPLIRLADVIGIERTFMNHKEEQEDDRRKNIADRRSRQNINIQEDENQSDQTSSLQHLSRNPKDRRYHAASAINIVVVSNGILKYGLIVDQLLDSEEIVVKPLGRNLKHCQGYAGATIMGDGKVALILDVPGLARMAQLTSIEGKSKSTIETQGGAKGHDDLQSLLIFRNSEEEQFSVPLGLVSRIEKIAHNDIEELGSKMVMKYRGETLPLVCINDVADVHPLAKTESHLVIVFNLAGKEIGLLATSPLDAMTLTAKFDDSTLKQPGILGSAIINDHTTLMVDIFGLVEIVNPDWFADREVVKDSGGEASSILYAEDSTFFRNQVKGFMEDDGYKVIEAEDGLIAWDLLEKHSDKISLIVTDIEMPNMDGFDLSAKIKKDDRFSHLPIIALTTLASEEDTAKGKALGIDDYLIKLDREKLRDSIYKHLQSK